MSCRLLRLDDPSRGAGGRVQHHVHWHVQVLLAQFTHGFEVVSRDAERVVLGVAIPGELKLKPSSIRGTMFR
jgi:hypothetical protein